MIWDPINLDTTIWDPIDLDPMIWDPIDLFGAKKRVKLLG